MIGIVNKKISIAKELRSKIEWENALVKYTKYSPNNINYNKSCYITFLRKYVTHYDTFKLRLQRCRGLLSGGHTKKASLFCIKTKTYIFLPL